jgi:hypothetical protein
MEAQTVLCLNDVGSAVVSMFAEFCNIADDAFFMSPFLTCDIQQAPDVRRRVCDTLLKVRP